MTTTTASSFLLMQKQAIRYRSISITCNNGLDIEIVWNVGNHFGKLSGSGDLKSAMTQAIHYNNHNSFRRVDVTNDLAELSKMAEAANWDWDETFASASKPVQQPEPENQSN